MNDIPPSSNEPPPYPGQDPYSGQGQQYPPPAPGPPPGYGPPSTYGNSGNYGQGWGPLRKHPNATTSMVLGIVGLASLMLCGVLLFLSPVAWVLGAKSVKAINAQPHAYTGSGEAQAGMILGIIGTVFLILGIVFWGFAITLELLDSAA